MNQNQFEECWGKVITALVKEKSNAITASELSSMRDYFDELHEKAERCDELEGEIVNLRHTINRL